MRETSLISASASISRASDQIAALRIGAAIGVDVLAQQHDLACAPRRQSARFGQNAFGGAGMFRAPRVRHHAEGAEFIAAFLHGEKGADAGIGDRFGQRGRIFPSAGKSVSSTCAACRAQCGRSFPAGDDRIAAPPPDPPPAGAGDDLFAFGLGGAARHRDQHAATGFFLLVLQDARGGPVRNRLSPSPFRGCGRC